MASTDEWEVPLLVSEIVLAFTLLSAALTFLSAAYAFPATVPVTELADPPEKKTVFAAYPKSFKSLCFIEALATCVASIFLLVFGLDRHAYWLVILPAIWQSLAFARSICLRMMYAPLGSGWLLIPAACVIDMATAGFFVGAVVCAYQSSETSAKALTLIPSILSGIAQIKEQGITKFVYCDYYPANLLDLVICILSGELATVPWNLQKIPSSDTSVGHFTEGGDEAGEDSERPAVGNAVPKFIAEKICIGIMDCAERTERFSKQPHIVAPGYKFTITVVDQMEAKGQDILICFTTDGDPVASWNKEARGLQVTADGRVQDIVEYVQSVLCSECPM
ncbi:hypothetical protein PG995_005433 [Apiospora arundinis]